MCSGMALSLCDSYSIVDCHVKNAVNLGFGSFVCSNAEYCRCSSDGIQYSETVPSTGQPADGFLN